MRLTKTDVIQAAADIADEHGLNNLSLKNVAEKLNIRTPSLYNHITSLDNLLREVAHSGMRAMNERMFHAAAGISADAAVKAVSVEYFHYMVEHPGVYETIQWVAWHGNDETAELFSRYQALLKKLVLSCHLGAQNAEEITEMIMGMLHGYTTLKLGEALQAPGQADAGLLRAMETLLAGIHQAYEGGTICQTLSK